MDGIDLLFSGPSPIYWVMMQIGMFFGFTVSYPPNWYLVLSGVKPGM
jgi:hypothetical protein